MPEAALFPKKDTPETKKRRAPRKDSLEIPVLFPDKELLDWVKAQADAHTRNLTQEIVHRLKQWMNTELRRGIKGKFKKEGAMEQVDSPPPEGGFYL